MVRPHEAFSQELLATCARRRLAVTVVDDLRSLTDTLLSLRAWAVVDGRDPLGDTRDHECIMVVAKACAELGLPLLSFARGVDEIAPPDGALVIEATDPFGGEFFTGPLDAALSAGLEAHTGQEFIVPTYLPDLIDAALDLMIDEESGVWHLTHGLAVTPRDFREAVDRLRGSGMGDPADCIPGVHIRGPRLAMLLPPLEDALRCWWERRGRIPDSCLMKLQNVV